MTNTVTNFTEPNQNVSYTQALSMSSTPPENIRNITLEGTAEDMTRTAKQIRGDTICAGAEIREIKSKGKYNITVKCATAEAANRIEQTLKRKYHTAIKISSVQPIKPQIKITRLFTDLTRDDDIIQQIVEQNHWLQLAEFEIDRKYTIEIASGSYTNLIVNCDLELQKQFIDRGIHYIWIDTISLFRALKHSTM